MISVRYTVLIHRAPPPPRQVTTFYHQVFSFRLSVTGIPDFYHDTGGDSVHHAFSRVLKRKYNKTINFKEKMVK